MTRPFLSILGFLALASAALGADSWTLTSADFHTQSVTLKAIDPAGVHVTPAAGGDEKVIPLDQFLDIDRPVVSAATAGKFVLYLTGEDHVAGEPVAIKGNDLIWNNPTLGDIALPMKRLVAMTRPGSRPPDTRRKEDIVTLANGDTLRGIIADFTGGKVTVQGDAGNTDVPIASVGQISFAAAAGGNIAGTAYRVRFDDGSILIAASVSVTGDKIDLSFGKSAAHSLDLAHVGSIEQVNGPVSWLSSRTPTEDVYIPFLGSPRNGTARMDHDWSGDPIRFGAQQFSHGIGVHSYSKLSWPLDGTYKAFRARFAIDTKDANTRADVTVRILLDDKSAYELTHVRAGALSPVVLKELGSAKKLTLEVDYGDNMDTQDRLNWIEPALLKQVPQ